MRFQKQLLDWNIKQIYVLLLLLTVLVDLVCNGQVQLGNYFDGLRQVVIEVFLVGLIVTYSIEVPARFKARRDAWDAVYDFKDGTDSYSQGRVRSAFRDLLTAGVKRFRFYAPKGVDLRDFSNLRIENARIDDSLFIRVDFTRIKWFGVKVSDTTFKDVQFKSAVLSRCSFTRCTFKGIDFSKLNLNRSNSDFVNCEFINCINSPI